MPIIKIAFLLLALLCFLVGTVNPQPPGNAARINWVSAGLAALVIAYFVGA